MSAMKQARFLHLSLCVLSILLVAFPACSSAPTEPADTVPAEPPPPAEPKPGDRVDIPAGSFTMGSDERPKGEDPQLYEPAHEVEVGAFQMGVFEVTNAEFSRFQLEQDDYIAEGDWRRFYSIDKVDFPVVNVTFDDAEAYCKWAGGRLPTEEEWEYAARGPESFKYPWGNDWDPTKANVNEMGFRAPVEAGQMNLDVSPFGVHDMFGNVQEWVNAKLRPYPKSPARRDPNFTHGYIVVRGASSAIKGSSFALWTRGAYLPKAQYGIGFRCAWDVPAEGDSSQSN